MKIFHVSFVVLLITIFSSCADKNGQAPTIISGTITNTDATELTIESATDTNKFTDAIDTDNKFADTLSLPKGYYYLKVDRERAEVYLEPGYNLDINIDFNEFDESISYTGIGADINTYLIEKLRATEGLGELSSLRTLTVLGEEDYLLAIDSIKNMYTLLLDTKSNLSKELKHLETKRNELDYAKKLNVYEDYHRYFAKKDSFIVSDNFPDPSPYLDLSDEKLLITPEYADILQNYIYNLNEESFGDVEDAYDPYYILQTIDKQISNQAIKNVLAFATVERGLRFTEKLNETYNAYIKMSSDEGNKQQIGEFYTSLQKIQPGQPSPTFELYDIDSNLVSLDDLKGKITYIDVWATWCNPCRKEIPHLKELEEEYHDAEINFVSICVWDKEDSWRKTVNELELKGYQLFIEDRTHSFLSEYMIKGVPTFILLDRDGNIISSNAKRPSNKNIREELNGFLAS